MDSDATSSEPEPVRSRRRKRRKNPALARTHRLWQDWWVEFVVAFLFLLAIFLLVEQMEIRETLSAWLLAAVHGLGSLVHAIAVGLARFVQGTTLSDLVAYLLIVVVLVLVGWRTRSRVLANPELSELRCPRCGADLSRIHRRWYHRLLSHIVPVRRYRCKAQDCGWQGLRVKKEG